MYSKIHWITCDSKHSASFLEYYDSVITPSIKNCEHHKGHHLIQLHPGEWVLISNFHTYSDAHICLHMIDELIEKIGENLDETDLEYITQGEVVRSF